MKDTLSLKLGVNQLPPDYIEISGQPIFFSHEYNQLGNYTTYVTYYLLETSGKSVLGKIIFSLLDGEAISLAGSPFGGFVLDKMTRDGFEFFLQGIINDLKEKEVRKIIIRNSADCYQLNSGLMIEPFLHRRGFQTAFEDINHHIVINQDHLFDRMHKMEQRKWKKLKDKALQVKSVSVDELPAIYQFIESCRKEKNIAINISYAQLENSFQNFPDHYMAMALFGNEEIQAATILVRVTPDVLYNYLPASAEKTKKESPMVYLMDGIYQYARKMNISILDLGISSIEGKPQSGLIQFKERMGGIRLLKKTYILA